MTKQEAYHAREIRALKKCWFLFIILLAPFLFVIPYVVPFLNSINELYRVIFLAAYIFMFVFVIIGVGYRISLRGTKLTEEERIAILGE